MCAGELARAHKASCFHSITRRPRSCGNVDVDNFFVSHRATGARRRERRRPRRPCGARQASREERMYKKIKQRRREMATAGAAPTPSILHFPLYTGVGGIVQQTDLLAANAVHFPESRRPSGLNQSVCSSFVTAAPLQINWVAD